MLKRILGSLEALAVKLPPVYLGIVAAVGALGFIYILSFPFITYSSLQNIVIGILDLVKGDIKDINAWLNLLPWVLLAAVSIMVIHSFFTTRLPLPVGIELDREKTPKLFEMIDELRGSYKWVQIDRVIITDEFDTDIVTTPRYFLPVWNTHTLKIGLPMLQCLSPLHFQCMLARKMGQFSKHKNFFPNLLYQLRHDWQAYNEAFASRKSFGILPLSLFFKAYAPFYRLISTYAARMEELSADNWALHTLNDEDFLEAIEKAAIGKEFVENMFWPKIRKIIDQKPRANPAAFDKLVSMYIGIEYKPNVMNLLKPAFSNIVPPDRPTPSLRTRLENIGHSKLIKPNPNTSVAAIELLDKVYVKIVAGINKLWLNKTASVWKAEALKKHELRVEMNSLRQKSQKTKLSYKEMWKYAKLQRSLYGSEMSIPWHKLILRKLPETAALK